MQHKSLTGIAILLLIIASCSAQKKPKFSRYVTDDPYFTFPSTIQSVVIYEVTDTAEVPTLRISVEGRNKLKHESLGQQEESYDIETYNAEGILEQRKSFRNGRLVLTNIYLPTAIGVPVLDYQINEAGAKEQKWKPVVDIAKRTVTRVQAEATPFLSSQDVAYQYNDKKQLYSVNHKFKDRGFTEFYQYDSLGNVTRNYEERDDKEPSESTSEYKFDEHGNWIYRRTIMKGPGYNSEYTTKRQITYFPKE